MALSNIFNEPRREITETAVGIAVFSVPIAALYGGAKFIQYYGIETNLWMAMLFTFLVAALVAAGIFGLFLLSLIVHEVGEDICSELEIRGIYLCGRRN